MKKLFLLVLAMILIIGLFPVATSAIEVPYSDSYGECRIKVNGKASPDFAYTCRGNIYVSYGTLRNYGDTSKLVLDKDNLQLKFNAADLNFNFVDPEVGKFIKENAGLCYLPVKYFDPHGRSTKDYYISLGSVAQLAKLTWNFTGKIVELAQYSDATNYASAGVLSNVAASLYNSGVATLNTGESVFIIGESKSFYKVKTMKGEAYYVNKEELRRIENASGIFDFEYIPRKKDNYAGRKINLVWLNLADSATRTPLPPENNGGIDILAYPWAHQIVNGGGACRHSCDYGIVQLAHQMGYKVWLTVNNSFSASGSTNYTTALLKDEAQSDRIIAQYLLYACIYNVDGINVDYEDMAVGTASDLGKFCAKLAGYCDKLGLTSSVDTYAYTPYNTTKYDFETMGKTMDFVVPMMYGENLRADVGSVSSLGWYTEVMNNMKKVVPAEKTLMGVPFFSRFYYLDSAGKNVPGKSGTITMGNARSRIMEKGAVPYWAEKDGQFIVEYPADEEGYTVTMWLEDYRSLALRINYVLENNLAGTACWALYDNDNYVKEVLLEFDAIYNKGIAPSEYYYDTYR